MQLRSQEIITLVGAEADAAKSPLSFATKAIAKLNGVLFYAICKLFGSFQPGRIEEAALARVAERCLATTSVKVLLHGTQSVSCGIFCQFNYGIYKNLKLYGRAPPYDLSKVNVPIAIFYSQGDQLCTPKDIETSTKELPNSIGLHGISSPAFSHLDFMFGKDADHLIYDKMIESLQDYN